jgi:hypothetical protein
MFGNASKSPIHAVDADHKARKAEDLPARRRGCRRWSGLAEPADHTPKVTRYPILTWRVP